VPGAGADVLPGHDGTGVVNLRTAPPTPEDPAFVPPAGAPGHAGFVQPDTLRSFDDLDRAGAYDHGPGNSVREVLGHLGLRAGMAVAEVGCGSGPGLVAFSNAVGPTGHVYEVDADPNAVAFIAHRIERAPLRIGRSLPNVTPVLTRLESLDLPPASIDLAYLQQVHNYNTLPLGMPDAEARAAHTRTQTAWTASVHAALRPGGHLVLVEMPLGQNTGAVFTAEEVIRFIEGTGLFRLVLHTRTYSQSDLIKFQRVEPPAGG
jgi:predicted methyltransferase